MGAKSRDVALDRPGCAFGGIVRPQRIDQLAHLDGAALRDSEQCQRRPALGPGYADLLAGNGERQRAQHTDPHLGDLIGRHLASGSAGANVVPAP